MNNHTISDEDLAMLVGGELDEARRIQVEDALRHDAELAQQVVDLQSALNTVKSMDAAMPDNLQKELTSLRNQLQAVWESELAAKAHQEDMSKALPSVNPPPAPRRWRWRPAVSIPLAAAAAVVVLVLMWTGHAGPLPDSNVAWAQVAQQLQKIKTASWTSRDRILMSHGMVSIQPADSDRWYFRAPDQKRTEKVDLMEAHGPATTKPAPQWDLVNPTGFPNTSVAQIGGRRFVLQRVLLAPEALKKQEGAAEFLAQIRNLDPSKVTRRDEEKQADGRTLLRFETVMDEVEPGRTDRMTIWVDPATSLPVRCIINQSKVAGGIVTDKYTVELSDLRFDLPLDEKLFAWPEVGATPLTWTVTIYAPPGAVRGQMKVAIMGPDGRQVIEAGDFADPPNTYAVFELKPEAAKQLRELCAAQVGKELTIQVGEAPAQKIRIIGPLYHLGLRLPVVDAVPTTQER